MNKHIGLLFLFIFAGILTAQSNQPKLEIPEMDYDFGKLQEGVFVSHEYVIKNTGTADLLIEKVRASCGCTAAKPDKDIIKPGEFTKIKVTFNTARRIGQQNKYVYVFTNDPENPDVRLTFVANVVKGGESENSKKPDLTLNKNYHNFGDVKAGSILDLTINVKNTGLADLNIIGIKSNCDCITTTLSEYALKPGGSGELIIDFDTTDLLGTITRRISILSDDPSYPEKTITLFVNIKGK